jgi:hypothetical protein
VTPGPTEQPQFCMAARADYIVAGRRDPADGSWTFYKSVNGTTWTTPTGWSGLTRIGRCAIATDGTDFYIVHQNAYSIKSADETLSVRKITTATDTLGAAVAFSDSRAGSFTMTVAGGSVHCAYRSGTVSPFSVRYDSVATSALSPGVPFLVMAPVGSGRRR